MKNAPAEDGNIELLLDDKRLVTFGLIEEGLSVGLTKTARPAGIRLQAATGQKDIQTGPVVPPVTNAQEFANINTEGCNEDAPGGHGDRTDPRVGVGPTQVPQPSVVIKRKGKAIAHKPSRSHRSDPTKPSMNLPLDPLFDLPISSDLDAYQFIDVSIEGLESPVRTSSEIPTSGGSYTDEQSFCT